MYAPDSLIQLSALQHYVYCPRQCALIHLEQAWTENVFTAEGRLLHEKADSGKVETRKDVKIVTGLLLCSSTLGVSGKADAVEFHRSGKVWLPYPVEYKRGRPKKHNADRIQLCAQAICLEEMLDAEVPEGALFYGKTRRRVVVKIDDALREETKHISESVHGLFEHGQMPPPVADERCKECSFLEECLPFTLSAKSKASRYLDSLRGEP